MRAGTKVLALRLVELEPVDETPGEFHLEAGPVSPEVTNQRMHNVVFPVAIRWKPAGPGPRLP